MKAHGAQLRASGDPYFSHPVEVAGILAGMKLDGASIITGLLHDTVEDTVATLDDIERFFGAEIARLVDGVTKLSRIELQSDQTKQAENFRKLVLAMSEDIRVLLVKLADRLHNMRTLRFVTDPEKRRRTARETMEIYAPLGRAHGHARGEGRARGSGLRRALSRCAREHPHAARLPAREGRGSDRGASSPSSTRRCARAGSRRSFRAARSRPIRSGARCSARMSDSSSSPTSWLSASSSIRVEQCYQALGVLHSRYPVVPGPLQGLHLDAQAQQLPLAPYRRDRPGAPAHRGADPHPRDARGGRARRRRALGLQAGRPQHRGPPVPLAARAPGHPRPRARPAGVSRAHQARDVPATRCSASRPRAT